MLIKTRNASKSYAPARLAKVTLARIHESRRAKNRHVLKELKHIDRIKIHSNPDLFLVRITPQNIRIKLSGLHPVV